MVLRLLAIRILTAALTLLFISVIVFAAVQILPGDVAANVLGQYSSETAREALREQLHLNEPAIRHRAELVIREFDVRPPNPALPARALSGGNQQKLIIGREFELPPLLLLISQPTRGVDIGAIEFIHRKIVALRDSGCAVLLVSAELEEVTALADRVLVLHNGRIAGEVDPAAVTHEQIGLLMTGGHA